MSLWLRIVIFPLAALVLGFAQKAFHRDGMQAAGGELAAAEFPRVTWNEAGPRITAGEWLLVDARDEAYYQARHIPRALSLPANSYPEMLAFFVEDYGTEKTVVIYCGTEDCDLSTELAARLRDEAGYLNIRILEGGFLAWQRSQP
jgi:rhodanese-related sulfurtransferase